MKPNIFLCISFVPFRIVSLQFSEWEGRRDSKLISSLRVWLLKKEGRGEEKVLTFAQNHSFVFCALSRRPGESLENLRDFSCKQGALFHNVFSMCLLLLLECIPFACTSSRSFIFIRFFPFYPVFEITLNCLQLCSCRVWWWCWCCVNRVCL